MTRTRVKICGITREEDAAAAVQHGADAIGLVFYAPSPRAVSVAQAARITREVAPFVTVTALFVNADRGEVHRVLEQVSVDLLQFHGDESPRWCAQFGRRYIKALAVRPGLEVAATVNAYAGASGMLLDAYDPERRGGTGESFDWSAIPSGLHRPVILAGGLTPDNVGRAVRRVRPYGVDVSSGVERAPGIKDADRIAAFMRGITDVDSH